MPAVLCRQEHTFTLLRNLVHGGANHARAVMAWAADQGNLGSGAANLLAALAAPLQPGAPSTVRSHTRTTSTQHGQTRLRQAHATCLDGVNPPHLRPPVQCLTFDLTAGLKQLS
jgi:hypothetical protein